MRWWWLLVIFVISVIQMTLLKYLEIGNVVPNVLLVLALMFVLFSRFEKTWIFLVFIGVITDLFSSFNFGTNLASIIVVVAVFELVVKNFFNQKSVLAVILMGFFMLLFYYLVLAGINAAFEPTRFLSVQNFTYSIWPFFMISVVYEFSIFILIFTLWKQLNLAHED